MAALCILLMVRIFFVYSLQKPPQKRRRSKTIIIVIVCIATVAWTKNERWGQDAGGCVTAQTITNLTASVKGGVNKNMPLCRPKMGAECVTKVHTHVHVRAVVTLVSVPRCTLTLMRVQR